MSTDISEQHIASVFRVKEEAEQNISVKVGDKQSSTDYTALYPRRQYFSLLPL
jgi:hypothetical protein